MTRDVIVSCILFAMTNLAVAADGVFHQLPMPELNPRVRIIQSTPERVVVHWRYMPNMPQSVGPENLPDQTRMVDEYFVITPDRSVVRAVLAGQPRYENWQKSAPGQVVRYQLTVAGIEQQSAENTDTALMLDVMGFTREKTRKVEPAARTTLPNSLPQPIVHFSFDEGTGPTTREAVTGTAAVIEGHAAYWRSGVSGTALQMDGWTSQVQLKVDLSHQVRDRITLDAWIAIAAYPWNTCPIVQQVNVADGQEGNGVMLAMEADGKPSMWLTVNDAGADKRISLKAETLIPRFRWTRLTGVADASSGSCTLRLYVDSRKVAETQHAARRLALATDTPVRIAQGVKRMPYLPVGRGQYPSQYSLDGLVDEVGIFNTALTETQIEQSTAAYNMSDQRRTNPDMVRRVLPAGGKNWNDFSALWCERPLSGEAAVGGHVRQTGRATTAAGQVVAAAGGWPIAYGRASHCVQSGQTGLRAHARQWPSDAAYC